MLMRNIPIMLTLLSAVPALLPGQRLAADPASEHEISPNQAAKPAGPVPPAAYQPLASKERWNLYLTSVIGSPGALFGAAGPALGAHLNNEPPSWGQGAEGYSKRFANRFGRNTLQKTYEAAGAAALGHDVRYFRSKRSGFGARAAHAISANFVTYDRHGRRTIHAARMGSAFAAEFTASLWMPEGYRDAGTAMRGAAVQLSVGTAFNLLREFSPELKKLFTRK